MAKSKVSDESKLIARIGSNIKRLRIQKGFKQKEFAYNCNIEPPNLQRIESGKTNPTVKTLFKISKELGTEIKSLFD